MATLEAIKYTRGKLLVLDQLRLPHEHHYDEVSTAEEAFDSIRSMRVRGECFLMEFSGINGLPS
jgi:methylthioribose-1-phosphate isomerase